MSETVALIAALATGLFLNRFWRHQRTRDALLAGGLSIIAAVELLGSPALAGNTWLGRSVPWLVLGGSVLGWALVAASAAAGRRRLQHRLGASRLRVAAAGTAIPVAAAILLAAVASQTSSSHAHNGGTLGAGAALAALVVVTLLALVGALAYAHSRERGPFTRLAALACSLVAAAWLASLAAPGVYAPHAGISDLLMIAGLLAFLVTVGTEWSLDERDASGAALAHERCRIAAEVHDLIMQDLSLALANARVLADGPSQRSHASMAVAAGERALMGARDVVSALCPPGDAPICAALEDATRTAARHLPLSFDASQASDAPQPDRETRDTLVHIAREAVTNAVKHARAQAIEVVVAYDDEWRLSVSDDGRGFDNSRSEPDDAPHGGIGQGFGLTSMRRHAEARRGSLGVRSGCEGTVLEVSLP
jgi:signal transduction histidine kinase